MGKTFRRQALDRVLRFHLNEDLSGTGHYMDMEEVQEIGKLPPGTFP